MHTFKLQNNTEFYDTKYINEYYYKSKLMMETISDDDLFELAIIKAFEQVISEQLPSPVQDFPVVPGYSHHQGGHSLLSQHVQAAA